MNSRIDLHRLSNGNSPEIIQNEALTRIQNSNVSLEASTIQELPEMFHLDSKRRVNANFSLNEVHRRERRRLIEMENLKMARKLYTIKSSIPARKSLEQEFKHHLKTKNLRCRLPIVNMKKNMFNENQLLNTSLNDGSTNVDNHMMIRNTSDLTR